MAQKRKAPPGLSAAAQKVWRETLQVYDLDEHEYPTLEAACRELTLVARIEDVLKDSKLIVRGSMGQEVANPLLAEVRQHRAAYIAFMKALRLPEGEQAEESPRTEAARKAAQARWNRGA
ncbi:hypothetical protein GCM10011490_24130 [Pseudoclavibacter endophyticus]|uniref:P27 family phage terminase small subunit n=1 Tax=Pseudoclavibacter endophyticus TaxID=1778590 RepID=A0A6H9WQU7_9MICO|nr:hypothetical protein [Pseudoclavibacter endophyticus]KAB1648415.1 hypothetical protein F8O04_12075 [Pseudoclavibacter endophyticus]GGA72533.1 hypothetical protein GCM10011490_24130 [Pseudoclavibacter endophyticus]